MTRGQFLDVPIANYDSMFAINVIGTFLCTQRALRPMVAARYGRIINFSTQLVRASVGTGGFAAYAATKGAIDTLVKHFAAALGSRGIRVNAVAPGVVETDMSSFTKTEAGRETALGMQALKRLAQPDDIAPVVAFLASEDARWITGDSLHVDGGSKL